MVILNVEPWINGYIVDINHVVVSTDQNHLKPLAMTNIALDMAIESP